MLSPSIITSPEVGASKLLNILIKVLLPAPENQSPQKWNRIECLNQRDLQRVRLYFSYDIVSRFVLTQSR